MAKKKRSPLNILIAILALGLLAVISARVWSGLKTSTPDGTAAEGQWPNLDVLDNYPNPHGNSCGLNGAAAAGSEKGASNALKNRYRLPESGFASTGLTDIIGLPVGTALGPPDSHDPNNERAVSVVGYVLGLRPGGVEGESCNCRATGINQVDTHIELVLDPGNTDPSGRGMVVVEVTERVRRLAAKGLLQSNIGSDWSLAQLKAKLPGHWVRFEGWLFYDADHHLESWRVDPADGLGKPNWRETCWEVHPVMGIEAGVAPPSTSGGSKPKPVPDGQ
jgi:hypothetical protein